MKCLKIENRDTTFTLELSGDELKMIVATLGNMSNTDIRHEIKAMDHTTVTPMEQLDSYPLYKELRNLADAIIN